MKPRHVKFLVGGLVIAAALGYLMVGGLQETLVYFVTPTELRQQGAGADQIWAVAVGLFALMLWVSRDRRSRNPAPP